jgi:proteasome assembly chaperone (PAC2) family protein
VQIAGMNPLEEVDPEDKGSYANASLMGRIAAIFAGPLANYLFASVLFFASLMVGGKAYRLTDIGVVAGMPAAAANLKDGDRIVEWPPNTFSAKRVEHLDRDVILLAGVEPHLAWRSYVDAILEVCEKFDVAGVVLLGALLGEASHAKPVRVNGSATAEWLGDALSLGERTRSTYQGPTGIVGVLAQALKERGIASASLWANIPFYVQRTPNPKGSLALLERLNSGFDFRLTLHDLEVFAARFEAQVAADIEQNPEIAEYARRVADATDDAEANEDNDLAEDEPITTEEPEELPDAASMVEDLERFLREQRGDGAP